MMSNPFKRASAMMAAVAAISAAFTGAMAQAKIAELGPYESRGKGGKRAHRPTGIAAAKRAARKARNVRRHRAAARRSA